RSRRRGLPVVPRASWPPCATRPIQWPTFRLAPRAPERVPSHPGLSRNRSGRSAPKVQTMHPVAIGESRGSAEICPLIMRTPDHARRSPNETDIFVGERVRGRRKELQFSMETLANRLGITFQQLQKY